ncbi:MAG: lysine biosynthesis protein LysX [Nitrosopumilus sp.]|jgi:[lysine-biosynthesis-protein LysW]--L-2-aminoadipate ligase|nr:lysine biosynthesis protein LysX [Nitrosopumilus sp.]MDH3501518.1 lysine biosynthesis protein LysX [Nitrosopumilus sp.]
MSKVCIVFDRLRAEEKMLQKEASDLGHATIMLDAKITQINTDSKRNDFDLGDVVLERCVSYFRGLHFTASLEFMDVPVLNKFDVANLCGNKMFMTLLLKKHNIPTPKTYFSFSSESASENIEKVGYPLVIKPVIGSWGRGVMPLKDKDTMDAILEIRDITDSPHDRIYYLQELVKRPPRDIRIITIGDRPIAAMYRKSTGGFKTNIALGADPELCEITKEMEEMATKASEAMGGGILGIDMMEDEEKGLVVHEVNNTVEFKGLARVSQQNIPKEIVEFALNYIRK